MKKRPLEPIMVALCLLSGPVFGQESDPARPPALTGPEPEMLLVEVAVNGDLRPGEYLVARRHARWLMRPADLSRLRIAIGTDEAVTVEGERFIALPPAISAGFDSARQRLELNVPTDFFEGQKLSASNDRLPPTEGALAAFLNYDVSLNYQRGLNGSGFVETGMSDDWGLLATTMGFGQGLGTGDVVRLESYYLRDDLSGLARFVVGDTVTAAPDWSRQVRFGGVRFGTDFSLQPNLITFPTPSFAGRTAVPSNVELLVNNASRYQGQVDQGPFSINQAPLVTGAGEVTIVLQDALGVERRVRTSYYVSPRLLARGLAAWSLEAGAERQDYGIRSFAYRNPFVAGTYRRGIADWLTADGRAELSKDVRMAGAGVTMVWAPVGEFGLVVAGSQGGDGRGGMYRLFYSRVSPAWNVAVSYQRASRRFDQLGIDRDQDRIAKQMQASAGVSLGGGSVALTWTDLRYGDGNGAKIASANYSLSLGSRAFLNLYAIRSDLRDAGHQTLFGLGLTLPLGQRSSGYVQADRRNQLAELRQTPPMEGGWGYRLSAGTGDSDRQQAEARWRGDVGEVSLEVARQGSEEGVRMLASGGLLIAGGGIRPTRRIEGGLGVVEVPGHANVRIYQENRLITRTNSNGIAIIPDLRPYEANRLSLAPSDLPLDTQMPDDRMIVVPRYRGAVAARFSIERRNPATVIVTMANGQPVEPGAHVMASDGSQLFVGQQGEIFLPDFKPGTTLKIDIGQGECQVTLPAAKAGETLPRIGPVVCHHGDAR
ncbi:fimbria/pilus outer membrane usher protein [Sphingobium indicum]|nr:MULTISPECIES: fimbria/pilus outer membrane usher protein [Sphingobium]